MAGEPLIREGSPPSGSGGSGIQTKIGPLPAWAWVAIAAAGGAIFFVWRSRGTSNPDTSDSGPDDGAATGLDVGQYESLTAQLRDIQGNQSQGATPTALAAPTALKIVRTDQLGVSLDWAPVPGAIGYRLYVNGKQVGAAVVFSQAYVPLPKRKTSYNVGVAAIANNGQTTSAQSTVQVTTK